MEKEEFNLETHLAIVDYGKVFGKVKIDKLFEILHSKNIPNLFLKSITEIYCGNKVKVNSHQKNTQLNMESDMAALYHPHYSIFTWM